MKKMKSILVFVLCLALVFTMTACGAPQDNPSTTDESTDETQTSGEKKKITWATWAVSEESLAPTYNSMVETYMELNPDVEVEVVTWPYAQYKEQLIIAAAGGNAPDIAHITKAWMPELLELGVLEPLNNVLDEEVQQDYYDNFLEGSTKDGEIMAAPWFNSPKALYYNKSLLEKAGVETLPTTWPELMEAARKISDLGTDENGNKIYGYALINSKSEPGGGYNAFTHLWTHGGDFIDESGNIVLNSPENIVAFEEIRSLYQDEISPDGLTLKDARNLFAQGVVGFYYDIEAAVNPIKDASPLGEDFMDEFGVMVIPAMDSPDGYGSTDEHYFAVFNTCEELEVAGDLLNHLTGETVMQILSDAGMGKMPCRESVAEMDIYTNPASEITKTFVESLPTARPLPSDNSAFMQADEAIMDALAKLSISGESVEDIVKELDEQVKELYGQ